MDPELQKIREEFETFKSDVKLKLDKLNIDAQRESTNIQYRTIVPQGVHHKLMSPQSVDPGHIHTGETLDLDMTNVEGYDLTKVNKVPQVARLTATFVKSASTVMATIPGMEWTVVAGSTYILKAKLIVEASNATGGIQLGVNGTMTISNLLWSILAIGDDNLVKIISDSASLGTTFTTAGRTFYLVEINAGFLVSVGGTVNIQFAQAVANGTSSVDRNSFAELLLVS